MLEHGGLQEVKNERKDRMKHIEHHIVTRNVLELLIFAKVGILFLLRARADTVFFD